MTPFALSGPQKHKHKYELCDVKPDPTREMQTMQRTRPDKRLKEAVLVGHMERDGAPEAFDNPRTDRTSQIPFQSPVRKYARRPRAPECDRT
ncbi:hypothetical protein EXIGLDRAFT_719141 [Exidia glandulosa HHB12029]|uniref:Uncharacterized protein n=1 Tax=Exidia glandulosa HHB12029 TaxID=1314781 RepID=A0A165H9F1_EXIGL|nr:hypothetical protein EXIGLDRAFT_719141 [Exidia glandulosa HHB12029]